MIHIMVIAENHMNQKVKMNGRLWLFLGLSG